ncbi:MAG: NAD-dependent deacylase, partial [Gammaproteobacteria bacterium]
LAAASQCDFFLSVGTSSLVYPAAGLAELAQGSDAAVAEINPQSTDLAHNFDFVIQAPAGVALPALVESLGLKR